MNASAIHFEDENNTTTKIVRISIERTMCMKSQHQHQRKTLRFLDVYKYSFDKWKEVEIETFSFNAEKKVRIYCNKRLDYC